MANGLWLMVDDVCFMAYGWWFMVDDVWL